MIRFIFLAFMAFALVLPLNARAQNEKTLLDIPAGHTLISLSTTERQTVPQDLLIASLRYEARNAEPAALQNDVNTIMDKALKRAKDFPDVKVSSQGYSVYAMDDAPTRPGAPATRTWVGQQGIELRGMKADQVLKLSGDLQTMGLVMSGLNYTVSPEQQDTVQNAMMESALAKLKAKADRAAKALGKSGADLLQVSVDGGGFYAQPMMMRSMAAKAEMAGDVATPVGQAGEAEITLTVNAQALLKP